MSHRQAVGLTISFVVKTRGTPSGLSTFARQAIQRVDADQPVFGVAPMRTVVNRHQEIGIRLALGADPSSVRRMVVGDGVRVCGLGSSVGLAGALGASQFLSGVLPGLRAWDLAAFLCAVSVSIGVALLAIVIPARAATRVDPLEAMRRVSG